MDEIYFETNNSIQFVQCLKVAKASWTGGKESLISLATHTQTALVISRCSSQLTLPLKNDLILLCLVSQIMDDLC